MPLMHSFNVMARLSSNGITEGNMCFHGALFFPATAPTVDVYEAFTFSQIVLAYNCICVHVNMYISTKGSEAYQRFSYEYTGKLPF